MADGKFRDGGVKFLKKVRSRVGYHFSQPVALSQVLFFNTIGIFIFYICDVGCRSQH